MDRQGLEAIAFSLVHSYRLVDFDKAIFHPDEFFVQMARFFGIG